MRRDLNEHSPRNKEQEEVEALGRRRILMSMMWMMMMMMMMVLMIMKMNPNPHPSLEIIHKNCDIFEERLSGTQRLFCHHKIILGPVQYLIGSSNGLKQPEPISPSKTKN